MNRQVDFSYVNNGAAMLQNQIAGFVRGIRGERKNPVTAKQITTWFCATPDIFVMNQLASACLNGKIIICRKSLSSGRRVNGAYVYVAP